MKLTALFVTTILALDVAADDIADVNAVSDRFVGAFNENSSEATSLFMVDDALAYFDPVPVLNDGKDALKQFFAGQFEFTEWVKILPTGPRTTRLTGSTGVVAQNVVFFWKPIDGAAESMFVNSLQTWSKVGDEWLLSGFMTSALPHGTAS